jgi:hypothetical protein
MNEHPILFSGPMVRAIRVDLKSQTRRVITAQLANGWHFDTPVQFGRITSPHPKRGRFGAFIRRGEGTQFPEIDIIPCPYGQPGDHLWVRETWGYGSEPVPYSTSHFVYRADGERNVSSNFWRPSIFMPRKASRIMAEITGIRLERLQNISEEDARAEGTNLHDHYSNRQAFRGLWDSINAKPKPVYTTDDKGKKHVAYYQSFPWADIRVVRTYRGKPWFETGNPWVWVIEFKRVAA